MATIPETPLPTLFTIDSGEPIRQRPDVSIHIVAAEDAYEAQLFEAVWDGEGKVAANFDLHKQLAELGSIRRPTHWGEDLRPKEEQIPEYKIGLDAMVGHIVGMRAKAFEIGPASGLVAEAVLGIETPEGWTRKSRIDSWFEGEVISLHQAVMEGAAITVKYQTTPDKPAPELGKVYYFPTPMPELHPAA